MCFFSLRVLILYTVKVLQPPCVLLKAFCNGVAQVLVLFIYTGCLGSGPEGLGYLGRIDLDGLCAAEEESLPVLCLMSLRGFALNPVVWLTPDIDYKELVKYTHLKQPTFSSRPNRKADRKKEAGGGRPFCNPLFYVLTMG